MPTPPMLAYTIQSWSQNTSRPGEGPSVIVGGGRDSTTMRPDKPQTDSYWIVCISRNNPRQKVKDWIVPGQNSSTVPADIDTYFNDPSNLFAVGTHYLNTHHVPQSAFYDFLTKYGAGRELQKLEQLCTVLGSGTYGVVNYVLTGQCGPRGPGMISYEISNYHATAIVMMMSLMPMPDGKPPYSISDSYTFDN